MQMFRSSLMAAWKLLGPGVFLGVVSVIMLVVAISTDRWYVVDASLYAQLCTENAVFEPLYTWSEPFYAGGKNDQTFTEHEAVARPMLIRESLSHQLPAPLRGILPKAKRLIHTDKVKRGIYRKAHQSWKTRFRRSAFLQNTPKNGTKLRNKVGKLQRAAWYQLMKDLNRNLFSFGGRDITLRKRNTINPLMRDFPNKSMMHGGDFSSCRKRQFSTATGLWRTCFLPDSASLLGKLVDCGNLSRCVPISYNSFDSNSFPSHLRMNETSQVFGDEITSLNLRRAVVSFLFLALTVQLFGLAVISLGWCKEGGFEQYAGGLVLLMSAIFQLCGMCTHAILCRLEMTRKPADVYELPTLVLDHYGTSTYLAWASFGTTLLSSFLCVMAPLHRPARPAVPCVSGTSNMVLCSRKRNVPSETSNDGVHHARSGPPSLQQRRTHCAMPCEKRILKVSLSDVNSKTTSTEVISDANLRHVVSSPVASVRTPRAAIKALEVEHRQALRTARENTAMHEQNESANPNNCQAQSFDTHRTFGRRTSEASVGAQRYDYMRKTRSLPRDVLTQGSGLSTVQNMKSRFPDFPEISLNEGPRAYDNAIARLDNAMSAITEGANERSVAEIFQSTNRIPNLGSDSEDCISPLGSPIRTHKCKRSGSDYEVWDAKSNVYLPCEMITQRRHVPKYT